MGLGDLLQKIERGISRVVVGRSREPLKIQKDIIDEIETKTEPIGRSRKTFPYNALEISLLARDEDERARLEAVFDRARLEGLILERLRRVGSEMPPRIVVAVEIVEQRGAHWREETFHIEYKRTASKEKAGKSDRPGSPMNVPAAKLVITKGTAREKEFALKKNRVNIGRMAEIVDKDKRVVRRNELVFPEGEDRINQSVSRAHAHIRYDEATGDYRLFDDQSAMGTRIFRDGTNIDVYASNTRGNRLQPGDEIYFGQASVTFELGEVSEPEGELPASEPKKRTGLETQPLGDTKIIGSE
jgi:pSer/pThr/pTyr-binding forkhead associated (FHA) protein